MRKREIVEYEAFYAYIFLPFKYYKKYAIIYVGFRIERIL